MNILAIDYGKKRLGLAWCNTDIGVVLPYGIVEMGKEKQKQKDMESVAELIRDEKAEKVIIGLPVTLAGEEGENAAVVRQFGQEIEQATGVSVEFIDERFTSRAADALGEGGASRDEKAAMILLENYITLIS